MGCITWGTSQPHLNPPLTESLILAGVSMAAGLTSSRLILSSRLKSERGVGMNLTQAFLSADRGDTGSVGVMRAESCLRAAWMFAPIRSLLCEGPALPT